MQEVRRTRVRIEGIVQGVGFRPFVHALADRLGLVGWVGNDTRGVILEAEGGADRVDRFVRALREEAPPLAAVERLEVEDVPPAGGGGFTILDSDAAGPRRTLVSPDTATCPDCLAEMADPADRRYRFPFTNCTNCGPRFTIITGVPYDRPRTTMAPFEMCPACRTEYQDPGDRRFHAQPVCCPACGPTLRLEAASADPVDQVAGLLREGAVVAIKGLGGYHLAADARNEDAVGALRGRKHREDKPFAVMVRDLDGARQLCRIDEAEEGILTNPRRAIVLLRRRADAEVAPSVAPGNRFLGVMLPYTPLHHLLAERFGGPFVLTSGNVSDEPIAYRDDEARERLGPIADRFLVHDRAIHIRTDDSVVRAFRGREMVLRRSRGYVPGPVTVPWPFPRPVLATGAELKNTFALAADDRVFLSHHIGDLENAETLRSFTEGIAHFRELFDIRPEVVAHDLHPEYLSTKFALGLEGMEVVGIQHHHAHVASCLADNGEAGPAIGVAFDGLGFGADGTMWGGEFLVADLAAYRRVGHLATVPMPGGAAAVREPWRMAAVHLEAAGSSPDLEVRTRNEARWADVLGVAGAGVNSPLTSSVGRLFDAVAAVVGVRDRITYEGQAAIELEQLADPAEDGAYPVTIERGSPFLVPGSELVATAAQDVASGTSPAAVAARFHGAVARVIVDGCRLIREDTGLDVVALSGGVFQNVLLLDRTVAGLEDTGFRVLLHSRLPPNDGGISLGQAAIAAARDRATELS